MRRAINHLSSNALEWSNLSPGVYVKMLNMAEDKGARTGLFKFIPSEGMRPPGQCHYHSVYEELLVLKGGLTFDSEIWLKERAYAFHPPFTVHGFNSDLPHETIFLARSPKDLDFNFPEEAVVTEAASGNKPFVVPGHTTNRDWAYVPDLHTQDWEPVLDADGQKIGERTPLGGADRETGEQSSLVRYAPGWQNAAIPDGLNGYDEGYVLEGSVKSETGTNWDSGDYWHHPPGTPIPALSSPNGVLIYSSTGSARSY